MTDSAVAHLAGALGKPVWLLLGPKSHWLWQATGDRTPWYPGMRLFRTSADGNWDPVLDAVAVELLRQSTTLRPAVR